MDAGQKVALRKAAAKEKAAEVKAAQQQPTRKSTAAKPLTAVGSRKQPKPTGGQPASAKRLPVAAVGSPGGKRAVAAGGGKKGTVGAKAVQQHGGKPAGSTVAVSEPDPSHGQDANLNWLSTHGKNVGSNSTADAKAAAGEGKKRTKAVGTGKHGSKGSGAPAAGVVIPAVLKPTVSPTLKPSVNTSVARGATCDMSEGR